jgi:serine/threonine-protein kinase
MTDGILWCPHCGAPHKLGESFCRTTGKRLDANVHRAVRGVPKVHPLIDTIIDQKYRVLRRIGSGGRGDVFEAEHVVLRRPVAIKVVSRKTDADASERLYREALAVARINHPNICSILDLGFMPDGNPYLVLERLTGETLSERLRRKRRLTPRLAQDIFVQVLSGLHAAHGSGILHRDMKPQNVFLIERSGCAPLVKVLDFGFALDVSGEIFGRMTKPGHACGTPQYMSPEQLRVASLDRATDIFSVGIMLFEALTGTHPFPGSSVVDTAASILTRSAPPVRALRSELTASLEAVVARALAKEPADRFATAAEMQEALGNTADDEPEPESTTGTVRLPQLGPSSSSSSSPSPGPV